MQQKIVKVNFQIETTNYYKYFMKEDEIIVNTYIAKKLIDVANVPKTIKVTIEEA